MAHVRLFFRAVRSPGSNSSRVTDLHHPTERRCVAHGEGCSTRVIDCGAVSSSTTAGDAGDAASVSRSRGNSESSCLTKSSAPCLGAREISDPSAFSASLMARSRGVSASATVIDAIDGAAGFGGNGEPIRGEASCTLCGVLLGKRRFRPRHRCRICDRVACGACCQLTRTCIGCVDGVRPGALPEGSPDAEPTACPSSAPNSALCGPASANERNEAIQSAPPAAARRFQAMWLPQQAAPPGAENLHCVAEQSGPRWFSRRQRIR